MPQNPARGERRIEPVKWWEEAIVWAIFVGIAYAALIHWLHRVASE
jgi:hypothetical protein